MFRQANLLSIVALATLASADIAHAAEADGAADAEQAVRHRGDDILVIGARTATDGSSGTKTDTPLVETPQSISVVTRATIEDLGLQNLNQALRFVAGVTPEQRGASAEVYDQFSLRGFNAPRYLDGLRVYDSPTGYASTQVDISRIDRYEVVKGPASVLYGQSSPGGLVAISSKLPEQKDFYGSIAATYGSYDLYRIDADVGGVSGPVAYRLYGSANGAHSQTQFGKRERQTISGAVTIGGDTRTSFTVLGNYSHDPYNGNYGVYPASGTLFANPNGKLPTRFYGGEPGDRFKREQAGATYIFKHEFGDGWVFRSLGRYQYVRSELGLYYTTGAPLGSPVDPTLHLVGRASYATREAMNAYTFDNQLSGEVSTGAIKHMLLFGTDRQVLHAHENFAFGGGNPIDIFNPVYGANPTIPAGDVGAVPPGAFPVFGGAYASRLRQQGIYAQDQMALGGFRLTLSGRYDWARTSQFGSVKKDRKFTYRVGGLYLTDFGLAPYVSYSTSFEPNVTTVYNDGVTPGIANPSTGRQIEGGLKYQPPGTSILLTASVFRIMQNDVVVSSPTFISFQTGRVRSKGVEFEATAPLPYGFNTRLAFSRQSVKTVADTSFPARVGKGLYGVGKGNITAFLEWSPKDGDFQGFSVGGDVRHVMSVFAGGIGDRRFPNGLRTPSYTVFDALLSYDLAKMSPRLDGLKLQVNASNLFDKRYLTSCYLDFASDWCWYGSRRTVQGTISYKW